MFSLFQDEANTLASNSDPNPSYHDLLAPTASGTTTRLVLNEVDPKKPAPPKPQDAWCNHVLKLKNLHPSPEKNTTPFQQFHSNRTIVPTQAILIPKEELAQTVDLPEVRQVRFLGTTTTPNNVEESSKVGYVVSKNHKNSKRVYWTRNEVESMKQDALHTAKAFRTEQPATVRRLKQLFEDFCWKHSNDNENSGDSADEEAEEMLHRFLVDWGMSNVRGLEERVVPKRVFDQDRRMALESVLAYQQILRESGVHSQTEMEAMLSTRSESASRRARMFAMYMALGDALAVATFRSDADDDSTSVE